MDFFAIAFNDVFLQINLINFLEIYLEMTDVSKEFYDQPNEEPLASDIKLGSETYYLKPGADRREKQNNKYFENLIKVLGPQPEFKDFLFRINPSKINKYDFMDIRRLLCTSKYFHARLDVI